jgi:hypothetical protein
LLTLFLLGPKEPLPALWRFGFALWFGLGWPFGLVFLLGLGFVWFFDNRICMEGIRGWRCFFWLFVLVVDV